MKFETSDKFSPKTQVNDLNLGLGKITGTAFILERQIKLYVYYPTT